MPMTDTSEDRLSVIDGLAKERGAPFKILIVDDEEWVRDVFRDFCKLTNAFEVDMAGSGTEAIEKAKREAYDLITIDLIMPEVSGLEALKAIKEVAPKARVMVVTGNATEKLINEAGLLGACKVLYKPVVLDHFLQELTATLTR
jgi:two-component system chemotaxis response regulator CheY